MKVFVWLLAALTCVAGAETKTPAGAGGGASWQGAASQAGAKPPVKPAARASVRGDGDIEGDIKRRFARSKISADQFTVKVNNGVAVIEGKTKVIQRKGVATRLAKLGGARGVDNRIKIDEAARAAAAAKLEKSRARSDGHNQARRRVQVSRTDAP